jgi:CTP:phosphocholine cytidylyltransferase-like protein
MRENIVKKFDYIQDPAHGWIKVSIKQLRILGIVDAISCYSYYRDGFAYLEEDCDASTFFSAYRAKYNSEPLLRDCVARERRSKIRSYLCYTPSIANNLINGL